MQKQAKKMQNKMRKKTLKKMRANLKNWRRCKKLSVLTAPEASEPIFISVRKNPNKDS